MFGSNLYILHDDHTAVPERNVGAWGEWMESHNRRVARTHISESLMVSTVFLGVDHQWGDGPPHLYETMCFMVVDDAPKWEGLDDYTRRYATWEEAERGHDEVVTVLKSLSPHDTAKVYHENRQGEESSARNIAEDAIQKPSTTG